MKTDMKVWAHRGCSQRYPENTMLAFEKALGLGNLEGIELDIQMTKDNHLVVIHDERVDRTTEGVGYVKDFTLKELKKFHIYAGQHNSQEIPTIEEVIELLGKRLNPEDEKRIKLNIELKNSIYSYPGMEEKIVELVYKKGIEKAVVYSSFYALSLERLRELDPTAVLGVLDTKISDCLYKAQGLGADALHPFWKSMDLPEERIKGRTVRAWFGGHLFPEKPTGGRLDLDALRRKAITDVFLNEPEMYL